MDNQPFITVLVLSVLLVIEYICVFYNFSKRIPREQFFSLTREEDKQERKVWIFLAVIGAGILFCLFFLFLKLSVGVTAFLIVFIYIAVSAMIQGLIELLKFLEFLEEAKRTPEC